MTAFRHRPRTPYAAAMDATPPSPVPLVQVRNLHLTVPSAAGPVNILRGIDLDIAPARPSASSARPGRARPAC